MSERLVRLAKAVALVDVGESGEGSPDAMEEADGGAVREDESSVPGEGASPENPADGKDLDLKAEDLANRLGEAMTAIGDCIAILKELGMESGRAESEILSIIKDEVSPEAVPGGLASGKSDSEFDPAQMEKGTKVELEHTGDTEKARDIAKDHLVENPKYYDYLEKMEEKADKEGGRKKSAVDRNEVDKEIYEAQKQFEDGSIWGNFLVLKGHLDKALLAAKAVQHPLLPQLEQMGAGLKKLQTSLEFDLMHPLNGLIDALLGEDEDEE
jgi:hypothetical protein